MSTMSDFFGVTADTTLAGGHAKPVGGGFWAKAFKAIVAAREAQARREANRFLARQSDRFLHDIGLTESDILELRRGDV